MKSSGQGRVRRGALSLVLAALALLLQVNAPVARAAAASGPSICHDLRGQPSPSQPRAPDQDHCAACVVCCSAVAAALPDAPGLTGRATTALTAQPRPELASLSARGPPRLRPPVRGPPPSLA